MKFRLATLADQGVVARLHRDSWVDTFTRLNAALVSHRGDDYPRRFQNWGQILIENTSFTYLAVLEDVVVGFAQGGDANPALGVPHDGELKRLYVAPGYQQQGIGKQLIYQIAMQLKTLGRQSMIVVAWSINSPARAVYEHLGARFVKEIVQTEDGFNNSQSVYVWEDIDTIIQATKS